MMYGISIASVGATAHESTRATRQLELLMYGTSIAIVGGHNQGTT